MSIIGGTVAAASVAAASTVPTVSAPGGSQVQQIGGAYAVVVHFPDEDLYPSLFLWPGGDVVTGTTGPGDRLVSGASQVPATVIIGAVE